MIWDVVCGAGTPFLPTGFRGAWGTAILGHRHGCGGPPSLPCACRLQGTLQRLLGSLSPQRSCVFPTCFPAWPAVGRGLGTHSGNKGSCVLCF